jgi:signal transduction histidine kinase/CheY-like chemotaxis protein
VTGPSALIAVVRERARVLAPAVLVFLVFFVVSAGPLGVNYNPRSYVACYPLIVLHGFLALAFIDRRVPDRWIHLASSAVLWCPVAATLAPMYVTGDSVFVLYVIMLVAAAGTLLHTGYLVGTLIAIDLAVIPFVIRTHAPHTPALIATLLVTGMFALLVHFVMRRALLREATIAHELARQLEERAQLADQLLHAQRMEAVGTLSAGLAHDMNNILASITSFASLLLETSVDRETRADLDQIVAQAERGASLTRGLLAFSRRGQYRKQVVRVEDVVRGVTTLLERTLPKTIEIRCELALAGACVDADPLHLEQALVNIGLNAADAMSGAGALAIAGERAGDRVRLRITDTGRGMDAATRLRVFEPFFTTKPPGQGTGLGLSIVWGIVHAHGGVIDVASQPGRGTTFTIELPVVAAPAAAPPRRPRAESLPERRRVLVVDDEPAVRESTRRLLERMGLEVVTAGDGAEALRIFDDSVELVILDMGMPVMNGAECFRNLRARSSVPVLIATGYAVDRDAQELVAAGARIIEKPFPAADFRDEVSRILHGS